MAETTELAFWEQLVTKNGQTDVFSQLALEFSFARVRRSTPLNAMNRNTEFRTCLNVPLLKASLEKYQRLSFIRNILVLPVIGYFQWTHQRKLRTGRSSKANSRQKAHSEESKKN